MYILRGDEIEAGLSHVKRVYLCGDLEGENAVSHIKTTGYEIGISDYKEYTFELAHVHTRNEEYNYVIDGEVKIFLPNEKTEHHFRRGDLYVIRRGEPYVSKETAGTRVIFSKVPGGNDKELIAMDEAILRWGSSWDAEYREE